MTALDRKGRIEGGGNNHRCIDARRIRYVPFACLLHLSLRYSSLVTVVWISLPKSCVPTLVCVLVCVCVHEHMRVDVLFSVCHSTMFIMYKYIYINKKAYLYYFRSIKLCINKYNIMLLYNLHYSTYT